MGQEALRHKGENWNWTTFHKWEDRVQSRYRFKHDELGLVRPDSRLFCMGSCFADNVAAYLKGVGIDAWSFGHSRLYDTASILMTLRHLLVERQYEPADLFRTVDGRWAHPYRNPRIRTDTREEMEQWAREVETEARDRLRAAELVIITLGGTETWRNPKTGKTYVTIPMSDVFNALPEDEREVHDLSYEENVANLDAIYHLLREHVPGVKLILTVSPIRMTFTVRDVDVAVATANGKSVLRAAAGTVVESARENGDLFYFHSYETVVYAPPWLRAFDRDDVHVTPEAVRLVMHEFSRCFLTPDARPQGYALDELALATGSPPVSDELAPLLSMSAVRRRAIRLLRTVRLEGAARALYARAGHA